MGTSKSRKNGYVRRSSGTIQYDREKCFAELCSLIANSDRGLHAVVAENPHLPNVNQFRVWMDEDDAAGAPRLFTARYSRAKRQQAEYMETQIREIADEEVASTDKGNFDVGDVKHKELRIKTRQWLMARAEPKKYGDRHILSGDADNPLHKPVDLTKLTDEELDMFMTLRQKLMGDSNG